MPKDEWFNATIRKKFGPGGVYLAHLKDQYQDKKPVTFRLEIGTFCYIRRITEIEWQPHRTTKVNEFTYRLWYKDGWSCFCNGPWELKVKADFFGSGHRPECKPFVQQSCPTSKPKKKRRKKKPNWAKKGWHRHRPK